MRPVNKVNAVLTLAALFVVSHAPLHADAATAPGSELPAEWVGDWGTPCAWQDTTIYLYSDINDGHGRFARNAVSVDGQFMIQPLVSQTDSFYWPSDCVELADGTLLVAAVEVINRPDLANDGWAFEIIDTDMFVVRQPDDAKSWQIASTFGKVDDGWWDLQWVEFSDQWPGLAFARDIYGGAGYIYTDSVRGARLPDGDGVFAPVQTADGWVGYSWDWDANTATLWATGVLGNEWSEIETTHYDAQTHAHGLNVIDGELWHRYSVIGSRPVYEPFTMEG